MTAPTQPLQSGVAQPGAPNQLWDPMQFTSVMVALGLLALMAIALFGMLFTAVVLTVSPKLG